MKRYLPVVIIAAVLIAAIGGGALLMKSSPNDSAAPPAPSRPITSGATQPAGPTRAAGPARSTVGDEPPAHIRGAANAPITLEEFSDFQCPTCGLMHTVLKQLLIKYPTQLRLAFRHFPLRQIHRHAAEAALAAEAAGLQGKFWEMHDLLYEKQSEWSGVETAIPLFMQYAQSLGLDTARFARDMTSTTASMRVLADERLGQSLGLTGTPTFFIDGRPLPYEQSNTLEKLSAAVDYELAAQKR